MACRGVHFAITPEEAARLLAASSDEKVRDIVQLQIEEQWDEQWLYETDKAWDAIHRCLTDGAVTVTRNGSPFALCILAGAQLHRGEDYIVSLKTPDQVAAIAAAISTMTQEQFRERYFKIDKANYGGDVSEDDFEYVWEYFKDLPEFYTKAAAAKRFVIFTVDQ